VIRMEGGPKTVVKRASSNGTGRDREKRVREGQDPPNHFELKEPSKMFKRRDRP